MILYEILVSGWLTLICQGVVESVVVRVSVCLGDLDRGDYANDNDNGEDHRNNGPRSLSPSLGVPLGRRIRSRGVISHVSSRRRRHLPFLRVVRRRSGYHFDWAVGVSNLKRGRTSLVRGVLRILPTHICTRTWRIKITKVRPKLRRRLPSRPYRSERKIRVLTAAPQCCQ